MSASRPASPARHADLDSSVLAVSWNMDGAPDAREERELALAGMLSSLGAQVVMLQECWDGAPELVAAQAGMRVAAQVRGAHGLSCAVLTSLDWLRQSPVVFPAAPGVHPVARAVVLAPSGRAWLVHSAHLAWGPAAEASRLSQVRLLEAHASSLLESLEGSGFGSGTPVAVLGGDFNCSADSSTVRFLSGLDAHEGVSTLWTDAWLTAGSGGCEVLDGCTSCPDSPRAEGTARLVGIAGPHLLPHRRIDFLMVRGYAHGRAGCPLDAWTLASGLAVSDHLGVASRLWDPPLA